MAGRYSVEAIFKAVDRMTAPVSRMQNNVAKFTRSSRRNIENLNKRISATTSSIYSMGKAFAAAGVAAAGGLFLVLREFSKIQDAEAAFTPLLGGAEKARLAVQRLNETAASTPFQFETLASSAQQLLPVMKGDIDNMVRTLRMLGDTAGGNAQKLDSITRGYTKAMLKGKVDMESLNMIAEAGVPIFTELAASMGTEVSEKFFKSISAGKVKTDDLNKAFARMTTKGGIFYDGMGIASRTLSGVTSTTRDNISQLAADIGGVLAPTIIKLLEKIQKLTVQARAWVKANRELIVQKFEATVAKIGRAIQFVIKHRTAIKNTIITITALVVIIKILTGVFVVLNLVMMANPIGLITVAIVALIAILTTLWLKWDKIQKAFLEAPTWLKAVYAAMVLITGPIGMLIVGTIALAKNWDKVKAAAVDAWDTITSSAKATGAALMEIFNDVTNMMKNFINLPTVMANKVRGALGLEPNELLFDTTINTRQTQPELQTRRNGQSNSGSVSGEVIIRDDTNRAEVSKQKGGIGLRIQNTGAFAQ